jgi:NAD(P)-dependent dehydrogenase (short-subunit alcohol dehydrogenase family)
MNRMERAAIVTGASSGIGRAAAKRLSRDGFAVLAVGRDGDTLEKTCVEIRESGGRAEPFAADVTSGTVPAPS